MRNRIAMGMPVCPLCEKTISPGQRLCNLTTIRDDGFMVHIDCLRYPLFSTTVGRRDHGIKS